MHYHYTVIIDMVSYQYCSYLYYLCVRIFPAIIHWPTMILLFLLCIIVNFHRTFIFSQISNLFMCAIFEHNNLSADKEIHYLQFLIINNKCINQFPVIKPSDNWKTEHYQVLSDRCKGDLDSYLNWLALGNLWKYTTVPSQCDRLPWTWIWRLLYFDCWYHFKKCPGNI